MVWSPCSAYWAALNMRDLGGGVQNQTQLNYNVLNVKVIQQFNLFYVERQKEISHLITIWFMVFWESWKISCSVVLGVRLITILVRGLGHGKYLSRIHSSFVFFYSHPFGSRPFVPLDNRATTYKWSSEETSSFYHENPLLSTREMWKIPTTKK